MKILGISNMDIWPQGENKGIPSIFNAHKRFSERGHEVLFLCSSYRISGLSDYMGIKIFRFKLPFSSRLILKLRLNLIWEHFLSTLLSNLEWLLFQFFSFFWLLKFSYAFKPDIIYVHGLTPAFAGWLVSRITGRRLVFRVHGSRDLYWQFKNPFYRIKEFRDYLAFKLNPDLFVITKDGTRCADLARLLGVNENKILELYNGVDFEMCSKDVNFKDEIRRQLNIGPDKKIILSLARLIPFYGVDRLIFSLPQLFESDPNCVCVVSADGPEKRIFEEFVKAKNISSRVFFLGTVERDMVGKLLNSADIFITLSSFSNDNNALMEAMICAKCIVSLKDDTIERILKHDESAILVKPGDIANLAPILKDILADEPKRKRLGDSAQKRAKEIFMPWPQRIDKETKMLESLLTR